MLNSERDHCFEQLSTEGAATQRKTIAGQLLGDAAGALSGGPAQNIVGEGPENSPPIDPFVFVEARVFTRQHCLNEQR